MTNEIQTLTVGHVLKTVRNARDHNQGDVAELTGIDRSTLSHIETGRLKPSQNQVWSIQAYIGSPIERYEKAVAILRNGTAV